MSFKIALLILITSVKLLAQTSENPVFKLPFQDCFSQDSYISGEECYKKFTQPEYPYYEWRFLEVPVDYKASHLQKTKISFRTNADFSFDKKTIIYFNGGPGGTSYGTDFKGLSGVNVIYFNQRGSAFSRPETKELFLDQNYYSSENTARDALEVVKYLGLKKVTAYGQSYGTVPATIFGSLFPEYSENVILEGVIYDGTIKLWNAQHRIRLMQKYFEQLDPALQQNILKYSRNPNIFPGWFSKFAQHDMYEANFKERVTASLNEIFNSNMDLPSEQREKYIIDTLRFHSYRNPGENQDTIYYSPMMFNFIGCKELGVQESTASFYAVFNEKNKLVPYQKESHLVDYCQIYNIKKSKVYAALEYPIKVPVYYFQGTTDGATTVENAIWHYKRVAKGKAFLVLAKNQGHIPVIGSFFDTLMPAQLLNAEIIKIFKSAINNEEIELTKMNELIKNKKKFWVKTQK